ncbi:hypothetical protein AcidC75_04220 [Acidisoma sp. C75]
MPAILSPPCKPGGRRAERPSAAALPKGGGAARRLHDERRPCPGTALRPLRLPFGNRSGIARRHANNSVAGACCPQAL